MPSLIYICRGGTWEDPILEILPPKLEIQPRPCPPLGAPPEWKTAAEHLSLGKIGWPQELIQAVLRFL